MFTFENVMRRDFSAFAAAFAEFMSAKTERKDYLHSLNYSQVVHFPFASSVLYFVFQSKFLMLKLVYNRKSSLQMGN